MRVLCILLLASMATSPAQAGDNRLDELERRLAEQQRRIEQLEAMVAERQQVSGVAGPAAPDSGSRAPDVRQPPAKLAAAQPPAADADRQALDISGDLRVRQEWNQGGALARSRSAVRARLRATYELSEALSIGARIVTGDPDDPNGSDVTLGNFADDFEISLDQAWIGYKRDGLALFAGKFPQIVQRTDMIWDADVSPQGVGATYRLPLGSATLGARALWFIIDEVAAGRDSDMLGGQVGLAAPLSPRLAVNVAGSYYHYRLGSVAGADRGDFRGNLLAGDHYLSDFHLLEWLGSVHWAGAGEKWPLTLTADYVRNLGAAVPANSGFNFDLAAGRATSAGDWRIAYNYAEVETDAIFTAFSHDNIDLASNYRLHGLGVSHIPVRDLQLDLLWYHYRPLDAIHAGGAAHTEWLDRIRFSLMVNF